MLAFQAGKNDLQLWEVAAYLLKQAEERKGQWKITTYGPEGEKNSVVYTEEEYSKLTRTIYHGIRNNTKTTAFHAGLENAAQVLWPTGSLDHVAMRHVGIAVIHKYITRVSGRSRRFVKCGPLALAAVAYFYQDWRNRSFPITGSATPFGDSGLAKLFHKFRYVAVVCLAGYALWETFRQREQFPTLEYLGCKKKDVKSAEKKDDDAGDNAEQTPPKLDAPSTPEDAENGAEASDDGRTVVKGDVVAVIGQNFDKSAPVNHMPIVGLLVGPCQKKPNVYSKTEENLQAAIKNRITDKQRKFNLSKADTVRIGNLVRKAMSHDKKTGLFSKERIQNWAINHFDLEECKSGKWSIERFRGSLENLYSKEHPTYSFKTDIKYECMPEGKAPRMLIADGDEGQLMALAVVKCFEELLFEHFEDRSIKHVSKREALDRVVRVLSKDGAKAVEGDGSAWDTTCGAMIRGIIENPILRHIFEVLAEFGVIPSTWMEEHSLACEQKKLRLFFKNRFQTMSVTIDAIRRSGHRGTSCLNWWVNYVMWVSSVFKQPERFLDVLVRKGEDLTGVSRWWNGCFEGDDSLCVMSPPMVEGDELSKVFLKFWQDAAFNMKIVFCDTRATFVGWHIGCTNGNLNCYRCPELPRALANSGVSVSTEAIDAATTSNRKKANVLAAASALARASDFSGILPTVSTKYLEYAESLTKSDFQDREMSIRSHGEEGHSANEVRAQIMANNAGITIQTEMATMKALGYEATFDEMQTFSEYIWSMEPSVLEDYEAFRQSLPPNWRT